MVSYIKIGIQIKGMPYENRIPRRIFGLKRDEERKRLHNEELHSLYRSLNIFKVIKSRRLMWAGYVGRMEKGRSAFKVFTCNSAGSRYVGLYVDGKVECILKK